MNARRIVLGLVLAATVASCGLGAASATAATRLALFIDGAGRVHETTSAYGPDCSNAWPSPGVYCGSFQWPLFFLVRLEAQPAPGWHFAEWDDAGGYVGCNRLSTACEFMSWFGDSGRLTAKFEGNDSDSDGHRVPFDCDDLNSLRYPGAPDVPWNGIDEDCDGHDDDWDEDNDGWERAHPGLPKHADCDDTNPSIHPKAVDIKGNGLDEDCDGRDG